MHVKRSTSLRRTTKSFVDETPQEQEDREAPSNMSNPLNKDKDKDGKESNAPSSLDPNLLDDDDDVEETQKLFCCGEKEKIFGLKVNQTRSQWSSLIAATRVITCTICRSIHSPE